MRDYETNWQSSNLRNFLSLKKSAYPLFRFNRNLQENNVFNYFCNTNFVQKITQTVNYDNPYRNI